MQSRRIAILEDDESQAALTHRILEGAGYTCSLFAQGRALVNALTRDSFDLCLLDWEVPDMSGEEVLVWMRAHLKEAVPVLFVTARDGEDDIVNAPDKGADDYLSKPIRERQLLARVAALLRRAHGQDRHQELIRIEEFELNQERQTIHRHGEAVQVTSKDFEAALFLLRNPGRLLSRSHIYESVWGRSANINTRTVDTHVSRVRVKLKLTPENGWQVTPIYQYGYRLQRLNDGSDVGKATE